MKNETKEIVDDVRTLLEYQKMMGGEEVPKCEFHGSTPQLSSGQASSPRTMLKNVRPEPVEGRNNKLDSIHTEIGNCKRCKLCNGRNTIVFGIGNSSAELMFIGEGPGADEDAQGEPFVGRAGQLLTKIIQAMGMKREDVYIGNVIKCRPPNNRNPEPDEIETCLPFLLKQIVEIRPRIIVTLGAIATKALLKTEVPITKIRGKFLEWEPKHIN